ncbi:MAG TPA: endolytic transglycosylase MltG, partial [Solirubrobacteraceae bacterium]|nr:endolytic transglycosylase MltG [Solirubrobacteraceae bacterium]
RAEPPPPPPPERHDPAPAAAARDFAPDPRDFEPEVPRAKPREPAPDPRAFAPDPIDIEPEPPAERDVPPLQPTAPFDPLADTGDRPAAPAPEEEPAGEAPVVEEPEPPHGADPPDLGAAAPAPPVAEEPAPAPAAPPPPIVPPAARRARSGRTDGETPVPVRRVSAQERRLPPTPPPPGTPAFSRRRRRRGRILAVLALLLLAAFAFGLNELFQPFKGEGGEEISVRIPPGSSVAEVGDVLEKAGIVENSLLFTIRARLAGADLKAGTYRLKKDSSYGDALDALGDDPAAARTIKVLIPEGRSRTETAPIVREAGLSGSYLDATERQRGFSPRDYGAPRNTKTLEGFLFPATYELKVGATSKDLVRQQLEAFDRNIQQVDRRCARRRNLTLYDVLIIASMVEREATLAKERPIIAAVIHNRLREGMPLGIDATIRYATRNWSEPLKQSELNIDSPYNTRKRTGLPPTPIGSPGLSSMKAAACPADVDYLYYVVKPGGNGAHNFSSTDEQFQRDVAAYNRERARRGGRSPADSE